MLALVIASRWTRLKVSRHYMAELLKHARNERRSSQGLAQNAFHGSIASTQVQGSGPKLDSRPHGQIRELSFAHRQGSLLKQPQQGLQGRTSQRLKILPRSHPAESGSGANLLQPTEAPAGEQSAAENADQSSQDVAERPQEDTNQAAPAFRPPPSGSHGRAAQDREADELELTYHQLHDNWHRPDLDWSGMNRSSHVPCNGWSCIEATTSQDLITIQQDGVTLEVRPAWISIYQERADAQARLFLTSRPLDDDAFLEDQATLQGYLEVSGRNFTSQSDHRAGNWHNYFIGIVGELASEEHEVMWPNRVLHGKRTLFNARDFDDLAKFLAEPVREDIESHYVNLKRLQEEKHYSRGWTYRMLESRWGQPALKDLSINSIKEPQRSGLT